MSRPTEQQAISSVKTLLEHIGEDTSREGLLRTPQRVVKAFHEMTEGYHQSPQEILGTTFEEPCDEMVVVKDIKFWSLCEHHLLPFHGSVTVGYLPSNKIVGLSKLARLVHCFARRLQVQEKMTQQIAHSIMEHLQPSGVGVVVKAHHQCMSMRGIKTPAEMFTSCLLGGFRQASTRAEFLSFSQQD